MENYFCHQRGWVHFPDVTTLSYASLKFFLHDGNMKPLSPVPWGLYPGLTVSQPPIHHLHRGTVIKKGKGASNHLAGRPRGLIFLGLFLPPLFALSGHHPLRRLMDCMLGLEMKRGEKCSMLRRRGKL